MPEIFGTTDFGPLDHIISAQRGVRGWLDSQDRLNARLRSQFAPSFEPTETGLGLAFAHVLEAGKFAVATEIKAREAHRQAILANAAPPTELPPTAATFNQQAFRSAQRALKVVADAAEQLGDPSQAISRMRDAHQDLDVMAAVEDGRTAFLHSFVKFNGLAPEDFEEVRSMWDQALRLTASDGVAGLLQSLRSNLEEFIKVRQEDDRGNRPHSPLAWWKWVLFAWLISSAVFAVIACFIWGACSWAFAALGAIAPWFFGVIDRGCPQTGRVVTA
jgi:hypothetical protein